MQYIGHTMAIPGISIADGIRLFAGIGMDGIEIAAQEGTVFDIHAPQDQIDQIIAASRQYHLPIVTLTPYFWKINSQDPAVARENIDGLCQAIRLAKSMGARYVRSYGGTDKESGTPAQNYDTLIQALQTAGEVARQNEIILLIENHPGTMTRTGTDTARVIHDVGLESVRALYDPANVLYDTAEPWATTLQVQAGLIAYVHCKDYFIRDGKRIACAVGEGIVPWPEIMRQLAPYDGCLSFEYEKKWYPDQLEDAETGLPKCKKYIVEACK